MRVWTIKIFADNDAFGTEPIDEVVELRRILDETDFSDAWGTGDHTLRDKNGNSTGYISRVEFDNLEKD